jgi:hypothetical protein
MSEYRNPSPPPQPSTPNPREPPPRLPESQALEEEGGGDAIRGTVFSKSWVLALLVRTVEYVSPHPEGREIPVSTSKQDCSHGERRENSVANAVSSKVRVQEVKVQEDEPGTREDGEYMDSSLEEDLCLLWDASMNKVGKINRLHIEGEELFIHQYQ